MDDIHEIVLTVFGDLPSSCGECVFSSYGERFCRFTHREKPNVSFKWNGCAYAKVLPDKHGRLIDADRLAEAFKVFATGSEIGYLRLINEATTVLEANNGTDN